MNNTQIPKKRICVNPDHITITGSLTAAYLLAQIIYWDKTYNGEFYNSDKAFADQLKIGLDAFKAAKSILKNLNLVSFFQKGPYRATYYVLDRDVLKKVEDDLTSFSNLRAFTER